MKDGFLLVTKDGEQIRIHPDALADHQRLGWKVIPEVNQAENIPVESPSEKPAKKAGK